MSKRVNSKIAGIHYLTPLQKGMMFDSITNQLSDSYHVQLLYEINGETDAKLLKMAWNLVVLRHEALRSVFVVKNGNIENARQIFLKEREIDFHVIEGATDKVLQQVKKDDVDRGFDLQKDMLLRVHLLNCKNSTHKMLISFPHIIMDGWCFSIILDDLKRYYFQAKMGSTFEELCARVKEEEEEHISYGKYVDWINQIDTEKGLKYWENLLNGYENITEIIPYEKLDKTELQVMELEGELTVLETAKIVNLSNKLEVTVNVVVETAVGILLQKFCGLQDVVYGKVVSGRNTESGDFSDTVGLFINSIPLRIETKEEDTVSSLIKKVQQQDIESSEYDYCPLFEIQGKSSVGVNLIKFLYAFENYALKDSDEQDVLDMNMEDSREQTSYDLSLTAFIDETLTFRLYYNPSRFSEENGKRFVGMLKNILVQMSENTDAAVNNISCITEGDRDVIMNEFNKTDIPYEQDMTIVDLFEQQVLRTPDHIAVVFHHEKITYQELNAYANALAVRLREKGVKANQYVGIMTQRSMEMIISMLGILKAGGVYVPIDSTFPEERIEYMLSDCSPVLVLLYGVSMKTEVPVMDVSDLMKWDKVYENPERVNKPQDLAYLIYTSGTTGKPKGVMVEHHGVSNLKTYFRTAFGITDQDRVLQFANYIFDASVWEIYMALLNGAALYIADNDVISNPADFEAYFNENEISVATLPPNYYIQVTGIRPRILITAGSESNLSIIKGLSDVRYINAYGPTETTVCASHWEYDGSEEVNKVPVGKPITNTRIYIMNQAKLCGIGVPGELCIAGTGVARGYLNKESLTQEKFIDNPFGEGKLYRSGDLARWLPDGNIEYLGRTDEQVKIRGFRIEPGEIENVIRDINTVNDCVVVVKQGVSDDKEIWAYIVAGEELDMEKVLDDLRRSFPEYMIPAYMMQLKEIPVTRSGKVDKKALPDIIQKSEGSYVAPQNEIEDMICEIFKEVLEAKVIGSKDNFFRMGGHSLKAARVLNEIKEKAEANISIRDIFENPTPELLAHFILNHKTVEHVEKIKKAEKKEKYEASSPQKRMYLMHMVDDSGIAYNIPTCIGFENALDPDKLYEVLKQLMERHVILRTAFVMEEGTLYQKPVDDAEPDLTYVQAQEDELKALYSKFVRPFDMEKTPLFRVELVICNHQKCFMFLDFHHIISDGISIGIFMNELQELYHGGKLEEDIIQYQDYSEWILSRKKELEQQKEFWLKQYEEEVAALELATDYPRSNKRSFAGKMLSIDISPSLSEKIGSICRQYHVTDFVFMHSIAAILLQNYTRQDDIVIGTPVSGRSHKDIFNTLGMFSNTLAMRWKMDGNITFIEFLNQVKEGSLSAMEHQDYSFDELVEELNLHRNAARNPLFDVFLVVQNNDMKDFSLNGIKALSDDLELEYSSAKFDLTIISLEDNGKYSFMFEYCTDLFLEDTIRAMMSQFIEIISSVCDHPNVVIKDVNVVSKAEKERILNEFNQPKLEEPSKKLFSEELLEVIGKYGERNALLTESESMSYSELYRKSACVAGRLQKQGIGAGDCVAIFGGRNFETMIGICGIILTGAAFVPIDPEYPAERIAYILDDCKPALILIDGISMLKVKEDDPSVIRLNDKKLYEETYTLQKSTAVSTDTAYIIYTSGTTGRPKGGMVDHRGICNLKKHHNQVYAVTKEDVILKFANIVFDASIWEITLALLNGAALFIISDETIRNEIVLAQELKDKKVSIAAFPPNYVSQIRKDTLQNLRILVTGGSASSKEIVEKFGENSIYVNEYGPTEITVSATFWKYQKGDLLPEKIPIGKPVINKKIYILNHTKLCGIGMMGELCIAGIGTAKGYLNNDKLTEQKFTKNPFGEGRLYRTGDLARWLPDGNIEYMGRMDQQVKIRGYRIELEEVENVLKRLEGITDAAVIDGVDSVGDKCIFGYITGNEALDIDLVKNRMRKVVPEYMVPTFMMQIDQIPVTENGKVDRRALPEATLKLNDYVEPVTENEKKVYQCFSQILGIEKIGIHDDFFALGGNSIKAMRIMNNFAEHYDIKISVRTLYENPTIAGLAKRCDEKKNHSMIPYAEKKAVYVMSPAERRMYSIDQIDDTGIAYNMPQALIFNGKVDMERLHIAFKEMIQRHEAFRTGFYLEDGIPVQKIYDEVHTVMEQTCCDESEVALLFDKFIRPFDLAKPPLVRMMTASVSDEKVYVFFDAHHIICDGGSMGVFWDEMAALYGGQKLSKPLLQYKDYSEWLVTRDKELKEQKDYWLKQYGDGIPVTDIPLDFKRPRMQQFEGDYIRIDTGRMIKAEVEKFARNAGITEFIVLLSALYILLHKYGRSDDITVGTVVSGRNHRGTERMIGMFGNTVALRAKPTASKMFKEILDEVRHICLEGFENQEFSFEELVENVVTERNLSRNPIFDVMMVFQNNEDGEEQFHGITVEEAALVQKNTAKFDLTFNLSEEDGYAIMVEYCSALFEKETIRNMAQHYILILTEMIGNPDRRIGDLAICTAAEADKIMYDFNQTETFYPRDQMIHSMFEEQARLYPDKTAIICEDRKISYRQLNEQANRLAHKLAYLKTGRNDFVVIIMEKSIDTICAILSVLKCGAAYVPVDVSYPLERIKYIISDCKPKLVLYDNDLMEAEAFDGIALIKIQDAVKDMDNIENPELDLTVHDTAYVIYTSGTTGKPKGVLVPHRGVANLRQYFIDVQKISSNDVSLQFAKMVFDASISEFCMSILSGGTMCIVTQNIQDDLNLFNEYIRKNKVTAAVLPVLYAAQADLSSLRVVITAGSQANYHFACKSTLMQQYSNDYGPTETTVCATHWEANGNQKIPERVPIGKPIGNMHVYIMDRGHLCGIGVPGELCIAGVGVADGYLNMQDLTDEKFIDNPFGDGKLYRSGDLARWLPDGNIDYLGRMDDQIKLRGFRIELGEIENVMTKHKGITGACVVIRHEMLQAYYTSDQEITTCEIESMLAKELPDYMMPQGIMKLDEMPVNQSGKIDKKALPDIQIANEIGYQAAGTEDERMLVTIFENVLEKERIGIKDDFFESGGDSIKAIRIASKIAEHGKKVSVKEIMAARNIAALVSRLETIQADETFQEMFTGYVRPLPIQRDFVEEWNFDEPGHFCQAMMLKTGVVEQRALNAALHAVVEHHDMLRAVYNDGIIEVLDNTVERYEIYEFDIRNARNKEETIAEQGTELMRLMDHRKGPIVKAAIYHDDGCDHLFIAIHHLSVDAVSWPIILEDFEKAYQQAVSGMEIQLPLKSAPFAAWSDALYEYEQSEEFRECRDYWHNMLRELEEYDLKIPKLPYANKGRKETLTFELDKKLTDAIIYECGSVYKTEMEDILLTALLCGYSNTMTATSHTQLHQNNDVKTMFGEWDRLLLMLEGHGRDELPHMIDINRTVGWFTITYPLLLRYDQEMERCLIGVKEELRKDKQYKLGYGLCKYSDLKPYHFKISFNYLGDLGGGSEDNMSKSLFTASEMPVGQTISDRNDFNVLIAINAFKDNNLNFTFTYEADCGLEDFVKQLADQFDKSLRELVDFIMGQSDSYQTFSDIDISADIDYSILTEMNELAESIR